MRKLNPYTGGMSIAGHVANLDYNINEYKNMIDSLIAKREEIKDRMVAIALDYPLEDIHQLAERVKDQVAQIAKLDRMIKICKEAKDLSNN